MYFEKNKKDRRLQTLLGEFPFLETFLNQDRASIVEVERIDDELFEKKAYTESWYGQKRYDPASRQYYFFDSNGQLLAEAVPFDGKRPRHTSIFRLSTWFAYTEIRGETVGQTINRIKDKIGEIKYIVSVNVYKEVDYGMITDPIRRVIVVHKTPRHQSLEDLLAQMEEEEKQELHQEVDD